MQVGKTDQFLGGADYQHDCKQVLRIETEIATEDNEYVHWYWNGFDDI